MMYRFIMSRYNPGRMLYLGVSITEYDRHFTDDALRDFINAYDIRFLLVNIQKEEIVEWI